MNPLMTVYVIVVLGSWYMYMVSALRFSRKWKDENLPRMFLFLLPKSTAEDLLQDLPDIMRLYCQVRGWLITFAATALIGAGIIIMN